MSKTLVLIIAASIPVGYVIWLSKHRPAKEPPPASSASASSEPQ
ncbi:MAG TPA: hypothetical protein VGH28_17955 [Polyangiaceae bacterium]|jgi:hypothetical protein